MEILLAAGIGIGLASIAGVRAFLPLALVGLFATLGLFVLPETLGLLANPLVIAALFVLAVLETVLDKAPSLEKVLNLVQTPLRILAGAVLFSAALLAGLDAGAVPELVVGAAVAGVVAVLKLVLRPSTEAASAGVSSSFLSLFEDMVAFFGGVVAVLVPLVPLFLVAFLLFFFFRVRRRRGRKYGGLRILRD